MCITLIKTASFRNLVYNMVNSIVLQSTHSLVCYRRIYALSVFYLFLLLQVIVVRRNVSLNSSGTPVCQPQLYQKLRQKLLPSILALGPRLGRYYLTGAKKTLIYSQPYTLQLHINVYINMPRKIHSLYSVNLSTGYANPTHYIVWFIAIYSQVFSYNRAAYVATCIICTTLHGWIKEKSRDTNLLWSLGFGHTYQANPSCPCYNYYIYKHMHVTVLCRPTTELQCSYT